MAFINDKIVDYLDTKHTKPKLWHFAAPVLFVAAALAFRVPSEKELPFGHAYQPKDPFPISKEQKLRIFRENGWLSAPCVD